MTDPDCICEGNWRLIIKEHEPLFNCRYKHRSSGRIYTFVGVVHAEDDYYYLLWNANDTQLLSCVGSIENFGYELIDYDTDGIT